MGEKHCKDIPEDIFQKKDFHFQLDDEVETLPELEPRDAQKLREKQALLKDLKRAN